MVRCKSKNIGLKCFNFAIKQYICIVYGCFNNVLNRSSMQMQKVDGDVPRSTSYGVYISQLIRFARVSRHVADFNAHNKSLTVKLLQQGYRYHKFRKTFSKFYCRHYDLVSKFNAGLKTLLHQGLSEPEFYDDLVYKFKTIVGRGDFF